MGYSIFLKGESFDHDVWVEELDEYDLNISFMGSQFAALFEEPQMEEIWLHPRGGVRGVTIRREEGVTELSLPTGVSEADFLLTGALVRTALAHGAVAEDEEGRILTGTDEEMQRLGMEYRRFFWSAIWHQLAEGGCMLPVGGMLDLNLDPSDGESGRWDDLESKQLDKMGRYQQAYIASLLQMEVDGEEKIFSNYHHLPTLISTQAKWVTINGESCDITEGVPVPADRFYEILADRVENLGSWFFIPKIDFTAEPELAAKLKAAASGRSIRSVPLPTGISQPGVAQETTARPESPGDSTKAALTGEDWMLLAKMAVLCTYMVAGADGSVDRKEMAAIQNILQGHQSCPFPLVAKILGIAYSSLEHIVQELQEEDLPPLFYFALLMGVLEKFSEDEAAQIKKGFLGIAQAVAEASSGLFRFGSKVSKREKEVLDVLKATLE